MVNYLSSTFIETTTSRVNAFTSTQHLEQEDLSKTLKRLRKLRYLRL
jgi:hypothetical protein